MVDKVVQVWCEYDIGQDGQVFTSLEKAKAWAKQACQDQDCDMTDLNNNGLLGFEELNVD